MKNRINLVFEGNLIQKLIVGSNIRTCINAALKAEKITVPCEINVLVTDDKGIQTINKTSRNIDKPTDVLSFPEFDQGVRPLEAPGACVPGDPLGAASVGV